MKLMAKSFAGLGCSSWAQGWDAHGMWSPLSLVSWGSTLKTFASPLWPGEGFKVCFSAPRICISDAMQDSRGRGGAEPAERRWRWARSCSCHRLGLTPRTWLDSGELVRDEAKLAENQSQSNFPSTPLQS